MSCNYRPPGRLVGVFGRKPAGGGTFTYARRADDGHNYFRISHAHPVALLALGWQQNLDKNIKVIILRLGHHPTASDTLPASVYTLALRKSLE